MAGIRTITAGSYNVHKAVGTDRRRDPQRIAAVIAEMAVDVLALQEVDTRFGERTGILDLGAIAEATGLRPVRGEPFGRAHGFHGNLLLARDAEVAEVRFMALPGIEPRGAVIADLAMRGGPLRIVGTHLGLVAASRRRQVQAILARVAALEGRPTLLMGDLNEPRTGKGSSLRELAGQFPHAPTVPSFPVRYPLFALDRIMASAGLGVSDAAAHDTALARVASDHLPVRVRLHLPLR